MNAAHLATARQRSPLQRRAIRSKALTNGVIGLLLLVYSLLTLAPFYFLVVRSLVPTRESARLHLWPPELGQFNMQARFGDQAVYFNLNIKDFKERMGIEGYVDPNATFTEIAKKYGIPGENILRYMNPFVQYNGWLTVLRDEQFSRSLLASIKVAALSILIGGFLGMATGSVLARFRKKWHLAVYNSYLLQLIIPPVMIMLPTYVIMASFLRLANTHLALVLLYAKGGAISTMVFTSYIATIPVELKESVEIDGGSRFRYFANLVVPLSKTPFATFIAIRLPVFWNWILFPLLLLKPEKYTLIAYLTSLQGEMTTNFQAIFAGLCLSTIPLILVYLVFQRLFVRSALSGAVKG